MLTVFLKAENTGAVDAILVEKSEIQLAAGAVPQGEIGDPVKDKGVLRPGKLAADSAMGSAIYGPIALISSFDAARAEKATTEFNFA